MIKKNSIAVATAVLLASCLFGCEKAGTKIGLVEKEIQGFKTKTFFSNGENVEVTIATDGQSTIVAVPKMAIPLQRQMGDDEYKCLKECAKIGDTEKRLNCILLCPTTKQFQVSIFRAE
jgi:hypothetical protein